MKRMIYTVYTCCGFALIGLYFVWQAQAQPLPPATTPFTRGFLSPTVVDQATAQTYLGISGGGGGGATNGIQQLNGFGTNTTLLGTVMTGTNLFRPASTAGPAITIAPTNIFAGPGTLTVVFPSHVWTLNGATTVGWFTGYNITITNDQYVIMQVIDATHFSTFEASTMSYTAAPYKVDPNGVNYTDTDGVFAGWVASDGSVGVQGIINGTSANSGAFYLGNATNSWKMRVYNSFGTFGNVFAFAPSAGNLSSGQAIPFLISELAPYQSLGIEPFGYVEIGYGITNHFNNPIPFTVPVQIASTLNVNTETVTNNLTASNVTATASATVVSNLYVGVGQANSGTHNVNIGDFNSLNQNTFNGYFFGYSNTLALVNPRQVVVGAGLSAGVFPLATYVGQGPSNYFAFNDGTNFTTFYGPQMTFDGDVNVTGNINGRSNLSVATITMPTPSTNGDLLGFKDSSGKVYEVPAPSGSSTTNFNNLNVTNNITTSNINVSAAVNVGASAFFVPTELQLGANSLITTSTGYLALNSGATKVYFDGDNVGDIGSSSVVNHHEFFVDPTAAYMFRDGSSVDNTTIRWVSSGVVCVSNAAAGGLASLTAYMFTGTNGFASTASNLAAPTSISSFPSTTVNWTNTQTINIEVYIDNTGVTATAIKKNGSQIFTTGNATLHLQPGEYFSVTYSAGTPVGKWSAF